MIKPEQVKALARAMLVEDGFDGPDDYNPYNVRAWSFHNEYGILGVALGSHMQEALDNAVDNGILDSMQMSDEDLTEYELNGWDDSFVRAGNAGEAFWSVDLHIFEVKGVWGDE